MQFLIKKKKTFSTIVKKNVGNVDQIEICLKNLPYHVFDKHDNCGSFCTYKEDKENYDDSRHFKNAILFNALKALFDKLAENAAEYSLAGSSQANKSLNNEMASHCPKSRNYSTTESADFRFATAVAHKNLGEGFSMTVMDEAGIKYGNDLAKYVQNENLKDAQRNQKDQLPEQKTKRKKNATRKEQLRMRTERSEVDTYSSNVGLFRSASQTSNFMYF